MLKICKIKAKLAETPFFKIFQLVHGNEGKTLLFS